MDYLFTKILLAIFFILITATYTHAASGNSSFPDVKRIESPIPKTTLEFRQADLKKNRGYTPIRVDTESLAEHLKELFPSKEGNDILAVSDSSSSKKSPIRNKYINPVIDTESLAKHLKDLFPIKGENSLVTANSSYADLIIELLFGEDKGDTLKNEINTDSMGKHFKNFMHIKTKR